MTMGKKSIIGGGMALLAALSGWFYKVATTEPVKEPVKDCYPNICADKEYPPSAEPEPELSWYDWAKSYIPDIKIDPPEKNKEDTPNDIIQNQLKGP